MYIPKHFQITDEATIFNIIETNSFATLISQHSGEPYATHIPINLDRNTKVLYGHFAKANPQWSDITNQQVLVIFQGAHSYISPSWYETSKAVPTWNYVAVHIYGNLEIVDNDKEIMEILRKQVKTYEKPTSSYQLDSAEPGYIEGLRKGIAAFKINISRIEGKAKLSQNHSAERQQLVIQQLEQLPDENSSNIAELMRKNLKVE
jgi:transcriptional regulator